MPKSNTASKMGALEPCQAQSLRHQLSVDSRVHSSQGSTPAEDEVMPPDATMEVAEVAAAETKAMATAVTEAATEEAPTFNEGERVRLLRTTQHHQQQQILSSEMRLIEEEAKIENNSGRK